jgi:DNA-binding CsgD family transcriptional regulator
MILSEDKRRLHPSALAPGLWLAWVPLFGTWAVLPDNQWLIEPYRLLFYAFFSVTSLVLYSRRRVFILYSLNTYLYGISCLLLSGSSLLAALAGFDVLALVWLYVGAITSGVFAAVVFLFLVSRMRMINAKSSSTLVLLTTAIVVMFYFLLMLLARAFDPWAGVFLFCVLPLALHIVTPTATSYADAEGADVSVNERGEVSVNLRDMLLFASENYLPYRFPLAVRHSFPILGLAMGFAFQYLFRTYPTTLMILACCVGMLIWVLVMWLRLCVKKSEINAFTEWRRVIPFILCFFMLLPFAPHEYAWLLIIPFVAAWACNTLYGMDCSHEIVVEMNVSPFDAYVQMALRKMGGMVAGMAVASVFSSLLPSLLFVPVIVIASALVYCETLILTDGSTTPWWRWEEVFLIANGDSRDIEKELTHFAERQGLTNREGEVLVYLAKGRNAGYIAKKLSITTATAKTHIKHLYAKTGAHTHQELLDMLESVLG